MRTRRGVAAGLAATIGILGGCVHVRPQPSSDCPDGKVTAVAAGMTRPTPEVNEALWVVDGAGAVRTIDGRTGQPGRSLSTGEAGPSLSTGRAGPTPSVGGTDPRLPPALAAGAGRLWSYWPDSGEVVVIDPATARVTGRNSLPVATPLMHNRLLVAHGALWISQPGKLTRVDRSGRIATSALPAGFMPSAAAATGRWLWLARGTRLLRIDPAGPATITETALPWLVGELTTGEDAEAPEALYASVINSPVVRRLDPTTGRPVGEVRLPRGELPRSLTGGWAIGTCGDLVRLADRRTVRVSDVSQDFPTVAALGSLWVGDEVKSEIVRVDAVTGAVLARIPFAASDPDDPSFHLVAGRSTVWVLDRAISRVDPATNRITRLQDLPSAASAVVA
jgi:hypothetical protein